MPDSKPLNSVKPDPFDQFAQWFTEAEASLGREAATAMCVSTIDREGFPDGRMSLLKHADAQGFVFYTNLNSVKGRSLKAIPKTALTFFWAALQRQVRVQGPVTIVSDAEADAYFKTRARASQIGAWASDQSAPLADRATLDMRFAEYEKKFAGQDVPRPSHWTGFRVAPFHFEFWQGRPNRLHDRFVYDKKGGAWQIQRLYP